MAQPIGHALLVGISYRSSSLSPAEALRCLTKNDLHLPGSKEEMIPVIYEVTSRSAILGLHLLFNCVGHEETTEEARAGDQRDDI